MQRQASFSSQSSGASGTSGFSGDSRLSASGGPTKTDQEQHDLLDEQQSVSAGVFGVLFTLSKEKVDSSRKFAIAKIVLEYVQLLFLVVHPSHGWDIDEDFFLWKVIKAINLKNPIINQGYSFYIAILYLVAAILLISLALCVWVGWCFKNQRFPVVWPIKVLRIFVSVFFQVFFIAALGVFLVSADCHWFASDSADAEYKKHYVQAFQDRKCTSMPHLAHMLVAITLILVFIVVSLIITAADFELNPLSRRWLAMASSSVEFRAVLIRAVATVAFALLDDLRKLQSLIIAGCMTLMCWSFIRWEPHLYEWMNHVRAGLYGSLSWASVMLCALLFRLPQESDDNKENFAEKMTTAMLAGLAPFWLLAMFISWLRFRYTYHKALNAIKAMEPGQNLREVYRWPNVQTVEMVSRVCRKWNPLDDEEVDPEAVKLAETVMKGGMAFFSTDPQMVLLYSSFLIEVTGAYQTGHSQLSSAKSLSPNYTQKFIIFVREQLHMQRAQTQSSGETSVDLVSYVEFQRNYRILVSSHRGALVATRAFWRLLLHSEVSFTTLSDAFHVIESSQTRAEKMYKNVMERYPSSAKILRLYAHFLEEVKGDPWTAAQFYAESEKMEEQQADMSMMTQNGDGSGGQVDERNNPVCVINAAGIIQMVNKVLTEKWGYKRDELNGKNVSILMPNPFSNKHNTFLRNYITTGKPKILDSSREVLALHKERYCFPVKLHVTKVSGEGADSLFMGVFRDYEDDGSAVRAYCTTGGIVLTCDARFIDWFGKTINDCVGRSFGSLTMDAGAVEQLVQRSAELTEEEMAGGVLKTDLKIMHKFSDPVDCTLTVTMGGTESQRLLVMTVTRKVAADLMLCCDNHGKILYCTTALANHLNYEPRELVKTNLSNLLPAPFNSLHTKWMKSPPARIPMNSCRGNYTVTVVPKGKPSVPVRCHILQREINEQQMFVVTFELSTFDDGMDERRLRLLLDPAHHFQKPQSVLGKPRNVFGQRPSVYIGTHLSSFVDAFRVIREGHPTCDPVSVEPLVLELIKKAREHPGLSYRCGVHPPVSESNFAEYKRLSAAAETHEKALTRAAEAGVDAPVPHPELRKFMMERQLLKRETRPVRLSVAIHDPEVDAIDTMAAENAEPTVVMELAQAEAITAVIELDGKGKIVNAGCCALHMAGIVFGCSNSTMVSRNIREFIIIPPKTKSIEYLMAEDEGKKKSALKGAHMIKKVGPVKTLSMRHMDGNSAHVLAQCVQREGVLNRYVLRCQVHKPLVTITDFFETVKKAGTVVVGKGGDWLGRDDDSDSGDDDKLGAFDAAADTKRNPAKATPGVNAEDEDEADNDGKKQVVVRHVSMMDDLTNDSARNSNDKRTVAPPLAPAPAVGKARRAQFQLAEDDDEDKKPVKRMGSPTRRKDAAPPPAAPVALAPFEGDIMSEKSSESGLSSAEMNANVASSGDTADQQAGDYRRGKRYKKLNQMLSSKQNQATLLQFQNHSALTTAMLMVAHLACFIVVIVSIGKLENIVMEMEHAGGAMDFMHRGTSYAVAIDAMYRNQSAISDYYGVMNVTAFDKSEIQKYANLLEQELLMFEESHQGAYLGYKKLRRVKDLPGIPLRTTWESPIRVSKIFVDTDTSSESNITTTLWQLGNEWTSAAREIHANHKLMADAYNGTIAPHREFYFMVENGPFALYEGYKTLLDSMVDWAIYEVDQVTTVLLILLCVEAIGLCTICVAYLLRLMSRVSAYRFSLFSTFLVVPTSFLRALASKKIVVGDEEEEDDDDDDEQAAAEANKAANASAAAASAAVAASYNKLASASAAAHHNSSRSVGGTHSSKKGLVAKMRDVFGSTKSNQLSMHGKRLTQSPFDNMLLLLPFFIWAALIVIIYAISYVWLTNLDAPTTMINVLSFIKFRVSRTVFYAVQLCAQTETSQMEYWQSQFEGRILDMNLEWNYMILGPTTDSNAHFARAESVLWRGMEHQDIVFRARDRCFRIPEKGACYTPDHYFYEVTQNGMGYMMRRLIEEFTLLGHDNYQDINMHNRRLNYIWEVGLNDLADSVQAEYTLYSNLTLDTLSLINTLHILLLVLSILLSLFFVVFMVRPFLKRSQKESRRVAELLSQLPADLDVEAMVLTVLRQAAWQAKDKAAGAEVSMLGAGSSNVTAMGHSSTGGADSDTLDGRLSNTGSRDDDTSSHGSSYN